MQIRLLIAVCFVLFWSEEVYAEPDNDVKRGAFPFMAFVYYPDETVVDTTGARFIRAASLISPEWLISSAIDHSDLDGIPLGFPRKTLLARLGAVNIDANLTLNEDEDEQEREVIQIVRPKQHTVETWWTSDVTLLKILLPFKMTSAVSTTNINPKRGYTDKNCIILVYAKKFGNNTYYKVLVQFPVELLPPSMDNCGSLFNDATMTCGVDNDDAKVGLYDTDFCMGNSGGPLICEGEILGLQTYIENSCKQPHLYTLLSAWNQFISCGTQEQCGNDEMNCNICSVTYKDTVTTDVVQLSSMSESSLEVQNTGSSPTSSSQMEPEPVETTEHTTLVSLIPTETVTEESEITTTTAVVSETESTILTSTTVTSTMTTVTESPIIVYMATSNMTTSPNTTAASTTTTTTTTEMTTTMAMTSEFRKHWPSEKSPSSHIKKLVDTEELKRHPKVEAQQQNELKESKIGTQPKHASSAAAYRNLNLFRILFAFLIFACNI